jgi:hypothetical protein
MTTDEKIDELYGLINSALWKMRSGLRSVQELALEVKFLPEADKGEIERIRKDLRDEIAEIKDLQNAIEEAKKT